MVVDHGVGHYFGQSLAAWSMHRHNVSVGRAAVLGASLETLWAVFANISVDLCCGEKVREKKKPKLYTSTPIISPLK